MPSPKAQMPDEEQAAAALRNAVYRVTPQRHAIQRTLVELGRHVSAEQLLHAVGERLPNVSLPTVYSALEALGEAGLVRRVPAGGAVRSTTPGRPSTTTWCVAVAARWRTSRPTWGCNRRSAQPPSGGLRQTAPRS